MTTRLAEIKERLSKATPGPWYPCGCRYTMISRDISEQEIEDIAEVCNHFRDENQVEHNKRLIANAPADIEFLLSEIERYRAALDGADSILVCAILGGADVNNIIEAARERLQKALEAGERE